MIDKILSAFADSSLWFQSSIVSVFLFGEYPYPTQEDDEE